LYFQPGIQPKSILLFKPWNWFLVVVQAQVDEPQARVLDAPNMDSSQEMEKAWGYSIKSCI
jgi:hypothetical protein